MSRERKPDAASEARLLELRRQASEGSGESHTPPESRPSVTDGYYGQPVVKAPVWTWEVPTYFAVGGIAGMAAAIAAAVAWTSSMSVEGSVTSSIGVGIGIGWTARVVALVGAVLSGALLVSDLGRPSRFLYMLRIVKLSSPMSIGAWLLTVFGALVGVAVLLGGMADAADAEWVGRLDRLVIAGAGLAGLMLATYTGVLLAATVIPVWASHRALLPVHFGLSSLGSAAAVLELLGYRDLALNRVGLLVAFAETLLLLWMEMHTHAWTKPLRDGSSGLQIRVAGVLTGPLALALRAVGQPPILRLAAAVFFVTGSVLSRFAWVAAGRESAKDPRATLEWQRVWEKRS